MFVLTLSPPPITSRLAFLSRVTTPLFTLSPFCASTLVVKPLSPLILFVPFTVILPLTITTDLGSFGARVDPSVKNVDRDFMLEFSSVLPSFKVIVLVVEELSLTVRLPPFNSIGP